jgi:PHD-finger
MTAPRCDICQYKDGKNGLQLVTCKSCNLHVHKECYGLTNMTAAKFEVQCPACKAVGKELEGRTSKGEIKFVEQKERPSECVLCSVSNGVHAMHPLYDVEGPNGLQLILPSNTLAWVHTLCANSVCQNRVTRGSVYGCDFTGCAEDAEDESNEDDGSDNSMPLDVTTHRYIMCGPKDTVWWHALRESRKLTCISCGKKDNGFRIPIQCTAGDADEYPDFQRHHPYVENGCMQAMHVGCAMWGPNSGPYRRIFFYPGSDTSDPVCECYCPRHAMDIGVKSTVTAKAQLIRQTSQGMTHDGRQQKQLVEPVRRSSKIDSQISRSSLKVAESVKNPKTINKALTPVSSYRFNSPSQTKTIITHQNVDEFHSSLSESKSPAKVVADYPVIPKVSSATANATSRLLETDRDTGILELSNISKKKSNKLPRPLGRYMANSQTVNSVSPQKSVKNSMVQALVSSDLPPPPLYQRNSSNTSVGKIGIDERKRKSKFVENDVDDLNKELLKKPQTIQRRYISESKCDDNTFPDDFDWVGVMKDDLQKAFNLLKSGNTEMDQIIEARRYFWRKKSGIYGSDFATIWNEVCTSFNKEHPRETSLNIEKEIDQQDVTIDYSVTDDNDNDKNTLQQQVDNKWGSLWTEDAEPFRFDKWDSITFANANTS